MSWIVLNHAMIAVAELTLAMMLFHRAIPSSLRNIGKAQASMVWLLAIVLSMFGTGRMFSFFYASENGHWIYNFGHYGLIVLGAVAYRRAVRYGVARWWDIGGHGQHADKPHI